jgi:hypothetical protein
MTENGTVRKDGNRIVKLPNLDHLACKMLAQWLYGQPLRENNDDTNYDLVYLSELYDLACDADEESGNQDNGLVEACLDAIKQCLTQKTNTLSDPIEDLEHILVRDDQSPGKAVILRQLVYGACATDGRTQARLEQYCASGHDHMEDVVTMVCLEFAKKACEQSQNGGTVHSASTAN